jgi:dTDP-4-dehydrorhamnose reductase
MADKRLMPRVVITGSGGQLAAAIVDAYEGCELLPYTRRQLDISDADAVAAAIRDAAPDIIINCAAFNHVDRAEDEPEHALAVNAFAVRALARAAAAVDAVLVHYSTDFVFDGTSDRPYTEEDRPNPQSVYAQSKLVGEWFAAAAPRSFILRVESLFGGRLAKSSIDRIVDAIDGGREAKVFRDRTVSPSYVADVARATQAVVERGQPGLYHCVGTGYATWLDVAREVARLMGKAREAKLDPISVDDVSFRAPRPKFAALANDKLQHVVTMPTWQDALRRYLTETELRSPTNGGS